MFEVYSFQHMLKVAVGIRFRDPFLLASITLGPTNDSPRIHLYRSVLLKQLAIHFDEKLEAKSLEQLRDAAFSWRQEEQVWTKQLDADTRCRTMAHPERLVEQVGNGIRCDLGRPPLRVV